MFDTKITGKVYDLKEMLLNSREYMLVKEKEKEMEEKSSTLLLEYNYLFNEYNQANRFKDYGANVVGIQQKLNKCKEKLDNDYYVKEYKKAYKQMQKLLNELQDVIFEGIMENKRIEID